MSVLCECGCGLPAPIAKKTYSRFGYRKGDQLRFRSGHNACTSEPFKAQAYLVDRDTGCWVWQRYVAPDGYGRMGRSGKKRLAHRVYYERAKGEIPQGFHVDHLCGNRKCVNPDHLEAVTPAENQWRRSVVKLTKCDIPIIRARLERGEDCQVVANDYGVSRATIYNIRSGYAWKSVAA